MRAQMTLRLNGVLLTGAVLLATQLALAAPSGAQQSLMPMIRGMLSDESRHELPIENTRLDLIRYYAADDAVPLFLGTARAPALIARMEASTLDGLDPARYPTGFLRQLLAEADGADAARLAEIEIRFAAHFLMFAADLKVGRVLPRMVYPQDYAPRKAIDGENVLRAAARFPDLATFLEAWEPYNFEYRRLKQALAQYLDIAAAGGWPALEPGPDVDPGGADPRVPALRVRLDIEDGAAHEAPGDPMVLDEGLEARLRRFQEDHDIPVSGALDKPTLIALNVPAERRIEQIALSMERLRWMPEELDERMLIVNKGEGLMRLVDGDGAVQEWRVLPNCPRENLSIAAGRVRTLVLNPLWEVPDDYFQAVLFPLLQADPGAVERQGYELIYQNVPMPITSLPWQSFPRSTLAREKDKFHFRLRAGDGNPLGRYIYRLDTMNEAFLFDAPAVEGDELCDPRISKGAIGVVDGLDITEVLLRHRSFPAGYLDRTAQPRETLILPDVEPLPLLIIFQSAWIDETGAVRFGKDPYMEDMRLSRALEGKPSS